MELHRHIFGSMWWKCWASLRPTTYWRCPVARHENIGTEWQLADMKTQQKSWVEGQHWRSYLWQRCITQLISDQKKTTFTTFPTCWVAKCIFSRKALHQISMHIAGGLRCIVAQAQSAVLASRDDHRDHRPRFTSKLLSWQRSLAKAHRVKDASCGSIRPNVSCAPSTKSRGKCKRSRAKAQVVEATAAGCIPTAIDRYSTGMQQCNTQHTILGMPHTYAFVKKEEYLRIMLTNSLFGMIGIRLQGFWRSVSLCFLKCEYKHRNAPVVAVVCKRWIKLFKSCCAASSPIRPKAHACPAIAAEKLRPFCCFTHGFDKDFTSPNIVGVHAFIDWCPHELLNSMHDSHVFDSNPFKFPNSRDSSNKKWLKIKLLASCGPPALVMCCFSAWPKSCGNWVAPERANWCTASVHLDAVHDAHRTRKQNMVPWEPQKLFESSEQKKTIFSFKNFREFPQVFSNSEFPFWNSAVLAISIEPHCIVPLSPQWISFGLKIGCNGCNPATLFRVPWFSCFLVSFPLRFSSFSCPNFGTSQSQSFASPSSYTSLALSHPTLCTNKLPFTSHKPVTPPHCSLDFAKATCFSASTSSTAWSRFPEPSQTGNFNVKESIIALFCSSLFWTISSKSPENNGKHHDQK